MADRPGGKGALLTGVGGLLAVIASFLGAASISASGFGVEQSESISMMDTGDGKWFLGIGILLLVVAGLYMFGGAGVAGMLKAAAIVGIIAAAFLLVIAAIDISDVQDLAGGGLGEAFGVSLEVSTGIGLYLGFIAGVVGLVGTIMLVRSGKAGTAVPPPMTSPPPSQPPPA